ncbi:MAG: 6-phosphofructokinase [Gammaproteobacteria bacterium]|nr:6-phosphofructokinase [Gammaproteobacteria bacterium]MDA7596669.1 6-phosphofructokinase [Gammaproteobacteria bacterium]RZO95046.1 MAG: 6-phosphofructokinase [Gammaproteobacteria bacterium]|tara:strand:- start:604 stop:1866 length:1263 start_codon:yes stop_codon:yes gene_type:complete
MAPKNAFYAQSGGVTSVINASAAGVIETARKFPKKIGKVFAGKNGILGALEENLIDTSQESAKQIELLKYTPGGAFGSARYKLKGIQENRKEYERLIEVFKAHDIGYFFYNGGGDSMDTAHKVSQIGSEMNFPIASIGIPKTVDNDLPITDTCPGFGSVAKYIAVSTNEASLDVLSMAETSTKVFILEVMGRHAGWIAAASGLISNTRNDPPHIILFPEIPFNKKDFLKKVEKSVKQNSYCVIVASEGARYKNGKFLADSGNKDSFGHKQLGGVAPVLAEMVKSSLGYKYHYAIADYLQRSARHLSSEVDLKQAYAVGEAAVKSAIKGEQSKMMTIVRKSNKPYKWTIGSTDLGNVANNEKMMPKKYITSNGYGITKACKEYMRPLINGEAYPPYKGGLPVFCELKNKLVPKRLKSKFMV